MEDQVIHMTPEELITESTINIGSAGVDLANKAINWNCPCIGGMANGPCADAFRKSFGCFYQSQLEPRGVECAEKFQKLFKCFEDYPEVVGKDSNETAINITPTDSVGISKAS